MMTRCLCNKITSPACSPPTPPTPSAICDTWLPNPGRLECHSISMITRDSDEGRKQRTSNFFSHASRSCSARCSCLSKCSAFTSTCRSLDKKVRTRILNKTRKTTHLSTVSLRFFSAASNSSSNNCTFLAKPSLVVLDCSPSNDSFLCFCNRASVSSSWLVRTSNLWLRELMSCSFSSRDCSYFLFFSSAVSARAIASSTSLRRDASF